MELPGYSNIKRKVIVSENNILPFLLSISEYMQSKGVEVKPYPKIIVSSDTQYQYDPFGRTAYYSPEHHSIHLYTAGRHIKDILRSFAHEMIHHNQNLTGLLNLGHIEALQDPRYAEKDVHLKKMEEDAYLRGNMLFRSWEDQFK
jgi:hypothetical protein